MEREKEVGEREEQKQEEKVYPNCIYRNREVANKIIQKGDFCIFGGTGKLYYKGIKKKMIPIEETTTRSTSKNRLILNNEKI